MAPATAERLKKAEASDSADLPLSMAGNRNPWLVALVVSIATFMEVLDTSIATVSLQHIAGSLAASVDESTWVLTSYLVSNAIVLPISGWLANVVGRKRFYMTCVALFTASSVLCGLAPSLPWLIVFRVLQGIGGGGLAPSEQSILADSFPANKRGMAFAIYGVAVVVAPAIGPTLGGWITDNYSWHWIFFINLPVGLASLALSGWVLVEPPAEVKARKKLWARGLRVDYIGFGLVALGLGCLQVVLDKGQEDDWFGSTFITVFSIVAGISLVLLVIRELTIDEPIVDLPLLRNVGFLSANLVMFAMGFMLYATTQVLPQLVQDVLGYTATWAGLTLTPGGIAVMLVMPVVGFLVGKTQPRNLIAVGLLIEAVTLFHLSGFNSDIAFSNAVWGRILQACGIPFLFVPTTTIAYVGLPPGKNNNGSALVNLARNMGGSFGISFVQTMLARRGQFHQSRLVEHLTPYDSMFQQSLSKLHEVVPGTQQEALAALFQGVQRQVAILSYLDVFFLLGCGALAMLPLVFLLSKQQPGAKAAMH